MHGTIPSVPRMSSMCSAGLSVGTTSQLHFTFRDLHLGPTNFWDGGNKITWRRGTPPPPAAVPDTCHIVCRICIMFPTHCSALDYSLPPFIRQNFNSILIASSACTDFICKVGKGKVIPLQAWTGPEGFRRLRLPDFKTVGTWRW